jgi:hypothetical protein
MNIPLLALLSSIVYFFIAGVVLQWFIEKDFGVKHHSILDDETKFSFFLSIVWPISIPIFLGMKLKDLL